MAADPCQVVDALAAANLDLLKRINRKFAALRNLAQLLEQLANIDDLIPNIGKLIPVVNIDLTLYENLVANCPYLNLPPATTGGLTALQTQLTGAYANMVNKLLRGSWNRMGQLQEQMDSYLGQAQGAASSALTQSQDFLRCLQSVCAAGKAVAGQLNALSDADIGKEITNFANNFAANGGKVLTAGQELKYQQVQEAKKQLIALGADTKGDYTTLKSKLGA